MSNFVNIDDSANYKPCNKLVYQIKVCKPPIGTMCINMLEQADAAMAMDGVTFISLETLKHLKDFNPEKFDVLMRLCKEGKAYETTKKNPFILCGTLGEYWVVNEKTLTRKYVMLFGEHRESITDDVIKEYLSDDSARFLPIETVPDQSQAWACFVPVEQTGTVTTPWGAVLTYNTPTIEHNGGDYIIAQDKDGAPDMSDRYVVNGGVFKNTYTLNSPIPSGDKTHIFGD